MTPPATITHGLPGKITETSLTLPPNLPIEDWGRALRLLGRMVHGTSFWVGDTLAFGLANYGERAGQYVNDVGLTEQSLMNMAWVAKAVPPDRRRETLSWSHHEAIAALSPALQEVWLDKAERGERVESGEVRKWSVSRLRTELRALKAPANGLPTAGVPPPPAPPADAVTTVATASAASPSAPLALGSILDIPNFGRAEVTAISLGPVAALVTLVHAK